MLDSPHSVIHKNTEYNIKYKILTSSEWILNEGFKLQFKSGEYPLDDDTATLMGPGWETESGLVSESIGDAFERVRAEEKIAILCIINNAQRCV